MLPTEETDKKKETESKPTGVGPGERLQAARIQMGLSVEDVANRMHLSNAILESIEENDFEEITAPIFVKGYLRAYARIVSLDEDDMIQQYLSYYAEVDPPITSTSNLVPQLSIADARIKWATALVVLVIVALLSVWWWNNEKNQPESISLDTQSQLEQQAELEQPAAEQQSQTAVALEQREPEAIAENTGNSDLEVVPPSESESTSVGEVKIEAPAEVEDAPAISLATQAQVPVELEVESSEKLGEASASQQASNNVRTAPDGSDEVEILVHADTWADIKDGSGHQMIYDLLRAGQSFKLVGQSPFAAFFGNGHGVEINFNGASVEIAGLVRDDNTARLRIGG